MKVGKGCGKGGYYSVLSGIMRVFIKKVAEGNESEKHYIIYGTWQLIGHREAINRERDGFKLGW